MANKPLFIRADWDEKAGVWVTTSDDVPGLVTEAENLEDLIEKLKVIIPELLEANGVLTEHEIPFEVFMRRFDVALQRAM